MTSAFFTRPFLAVLLSSGIAFANAPQDPTILEFGLDDTLFVADAATGTVFAYDLPNDGAAPAEDKPYNILDLDGMLVEALGAERGTIVFKDLAVHPVTREAYASVSYIMDGAPKSAVVSVSREGAVTEVPLADLASSSFVIEDPADTAVSFWRDIPAPTLTVTDLDFANDELFISGISTGEFASTMRRVAYPFGEGATSSSIEMYHAAHAQNETRAPIRAMTVLDLEGTQTVVAAYTCTPLVTIPVSDLTDGSHVTGKTIAELGYGNTPLDVIAFSAANMDGSIGSYVLVVNREMDADLITVEDLTTASNAPGLTEPVPYLGATAGVRTTPLPLSGVLHMADQDNQFLLGMRRNLNTGSLEMVSFRKGAFFRLSDFISEYNFPDYVYSDDEFAQGTRMFQNMLKGDEGFPDQMR
ncbi:MAG: hypothetical protein AAGJ34_11290 [Pseudomonadota bacterium]